MGYINVANYETGDIFISASMFDELIFKKARKQFYCRKCKKKYNSGTRYVGEKRNNYYRICMFCYTKWSKNAIKELESLQKVIKSNKKNLKKNQAKWTKEAMVGKLKGK